MKRTIALCVALMIGMSALPVSAATIIVDTESGETAEELMSLTLTDEWQQETKSAAATPEVGGRSAVLMEQATGKILYEKNSHEPLPIASVTKIMTLLLVTEAVDAGEIAVTDTVTCSPEAASMGGSQIWLEPGEIMTVDDLLKAAAVVSANDACAALAEYTAGSIEEFVERMNTRAAELGMHDTHFLDCSGLDDNARSSAYDVALMSRELMTHPSIKRYTTIWMDTLREGKSQLVNTNKLVRFYDGITGLKTGTTSAAGHNLSATAERDGLGLIAVILGCATTAERFGGARKLLDHGFANYTLYRPAVDPEQLTPIPVLHGTEETVTVTVKDPAPLLLKKGDDKHIALTVELAEDLEAPVEAGQEVGTVTVTLSDKTAATYPVYAEKAVDRLSFFTAFSRLLTTLCR